MSAREVECAARAEPERVSGADGEASDEGALADEGDARSDSSGSGPSGDEADVESAGLAELPRAAAPVPELRSSDRSRDA